MLRWLDRLFSRRSWPTWNTSQTATEFSELFGGGPTASGISVTPEMALEVPAVFACLQVLSQDIARTPIRFRRIVAPDTVVDAVEHDLYEILGILPNPEQTASQFKHAMQWQLLQYGRAYAEIVRVNGRVTALWPLESRYMRVGRTEARVKRWTYSVGAGHTWLFNPSQPPIFELTMETPLNRCRDLVGLALALQTYQSKFFANNGRPMGVLQAAGSISQPTADRLAELWRQLRAGAENAHKILILEGGLDFKPIGMPNDEAQMIETSMAITRATAAAFRVPVWKVGDMGSATYSNMAASEVSYVSSTLDPIYQSWEDSIRRDLLTNRQFQQYTAQFDRGALIRSDPQAQHTALATGIAAGFYSQNDARRALGLNPIPNGDVYRVNTAMAPTNGTPQEGIDDAAA